MDNGQRKAIVLVLGQLYRLNLASGVSDIAPADKIRLGANIKKCVRTLKIS